jgi:two-component system, cell cycle response regulator DivK
MNVPETAPTAPLILVVDDFDDGRELIVEILDHAGYRVEEARDGHEALEKVGQLLPDLVMMDLSLPGVDGWEVTRRIKAMKKTRGIPVMAFTAHALAEPATRALEAGCVSVLTKPCLPARIVSEVNRIVATVKAR